MAIEEDLDGGIDITSTATVPAEQRSVGEYGARAAGTVAGLSVAVAVIDMVCGDAASDAEYLVHDGQRVQPGTVLLRVTAPTRLLLTAERTSLNLLCHLSGVATLTSRWVDALGDSGAQVRDTRKTTPGLRALEKYAVRCGGGTNKRMGLYDVAMIKDNHKLAAGGLTAAYDAVRRTFPDVAIQVEVTTTAEAIESVGAGARFLLCDNMSTDLLRATVDAVRATGETVEIEATGNLTLEFAPAYAATGVDYLSVGGLTHSSPILDIALDLDPEGD
jgi:nicotinate-nucleotide pyrophosphorylase (carboxylating)